MFGFHLLIRMAMIYFLCCILHDFGEKGVLKKTYIFWHQKFREIWRAPRWKSIEVEFFKKKLLYFVNSLLSYQTFTTFFYFWKWEFSLDILTFSSIVYTYVVIYINEWAYQPVKKQENAYFPDLFTFGWQKKTIFSCRTNFSIFVLVVLKFNKK